jgi:transposase
LIADKGYSYARCRQLLRQRQIPHTIPSRSDQRARRMARRGRPLAIDRAVYARRNVVERCINRLKQWRGLATRYEKRAANYRSMLVLASIFNWLSRDLLDRPWHGVSCGADHHRFMRWLESKKW